MTSNGAADEPQFSTIGRPGFPTFGQDPNDLTNATGRLPNDGPHVFRATTIVHVLWQRVVASANFQSFSGKPWPASTQVNLGAQGSRSILPEPPGTRRLSSPSLLDMRVSETVPIGVIGKGDLMLDFNVLNDTAAEALEGTPVGQYAIRRDMKVARERSWPKASGHPSGQWAASIFQMTSRSCRNC